MNFQIHEIGVYGSEFENSDNVYGQHYVISYIDLKHGSRIVCRSF